MPRTPSTPQDEDTESMADMQIPISLQIPCTEVYGVTISDLHTINKNVLILFYARYSLYASNMCE